MTLKLCPDGTPDERTEAALAAAHDLTCIGEIMEALGTTDTDNVTAALVEWLGVQVGKATNVVHSFLHGMPLPDKPEGVA